MYLFVEGSLKLSPLIHSLGCSRCLTGVMLTDRSHVQSTGNDISFRDRKMIKLIALLL